MQICANLPKLGKKTLLLMWGQHSLLESMETSPGHAWRDHQEYSDLPLWWSRSKIRNTVGMDGLLPINLVVDLFES